MDGGRSQNAAGRSVEDALSVQVQRSVRSSIFFAVRVGFEGWCF